MSGNSEIPCYIARCKCGCGGLIFASVDDPDSRHVEQQRKYSAKEIAKLVRDGYIVERMTVGDVRAADWLCEKDRVHDEQ